MKKRREFFFFLSKRGKQSMGAQVTTWSKVGCPQDGFVRPRLLLWKFLCFSRVVCPLYHVQLRRNKPSSFSSPFVLHLLQLIFEQRRRNSFYSNCLVFFFFFMEKHTCVCETTDQLIPRFVYASRTIRDVVLKINIQLQNVRTDS